MQRSKPNNLSDSDPEDDKIETDEIKLDMSPSPEPSGDKMRSANKPNPIVGPSKPINPQPKKEESKPAAAANDYWDDDDDVWGDDDVLELEDNNKAAAKKKDEPVKSQVKKE